MKDLKNTMYYLSTQFKRLFIVGAILIPFCNLTFAQNAKAIMVDPISCEKDLTFLCNEIKNKNTNTKIQNYARYGSYCIINGESGSYPNTLSYKLNDCGNLFKQKLNNKLGQKLVSWGLYVTLGAAPPTSAATQNKYTTDAESIGDCSGYDMNQSVTKGITKAQCENICNQRESEGCKGYTYHSGQQICAVKTIAQCSKRETRWGYNFYGNKKYLNQ